MRTQALTIVILVTAVLLGTNQAFAQTPSRQARKTNREKADGGNQSSQWLKKNSPLHTIAITVPPSSNLKIKGDGYFSGHTWLTVMQNQEQPFGLEKGYRGVLHLYGDVTITAKAAVIEIDNHARAEIVDGEGPGWLSIGARDQLSILCKGATEFRVSGFDFATFDRPGTLATATKCDAVTALERAVVTATNCQAVTAAGNSRMRAENVNQATATDYGVIELHGKAQTSTSNHGQIMQMEAEVMKTRTIRP